MVEEAHDDLNPCVQRWELMVAQTLFMGATNLVLEGLTDKFLLNELVQSAIR